MGGTRQVAYGEGREALVDAAIRLVAREGLTKLTYRSLSSEAGTSKGAVQHHFANTDEVIEAALRRCFEVSLENFVIPESIDQLFTPLLDALHAHPDVQGFQTDLILESRRYPQLVDVVNAHQAAYREYLRSALGALGLANDEGIVEVLLATADGIIYQRVAFGDDGEANVRRQIHGLRRLIAGYRESALADS